MQNNSIKAQVHMLPQDKEGWSKHDILSDSEGHLKIATYDRETFLEDWTPQHLYFISVEKQQIKVGNWIHRNEMIFKASIADADEFDYYVIASTDSSLGLPAIPTTRIRDVYVPSNGSIKEVELELTFSNTKRAIVKGLDPKNYMFMTEQDLPPIISDDWKLQLTPNNEVVIVDRNIDKLPYPELVKEMSEYFKDVKIVEKSVENLFPKEQCGDLSVEQELEDAAEEYVSKEYPQYIAPKQLEELFIAGATWQKEQSATDAIEMLQWLVEQDNAIFLYEGTIQHKASAKELSKELYELWKSKK
jgi:hypothetical protein